MFQNTKNISLDFIQENTKSSFNDSSVFVNTLKQLSNFREKTLFIVFCKGLDTFYVLSEFELCKSMENI